MTMREVDFCIKKINKRTNIEYNFQARLHGLQFKSNTTVETVSFSKDDDDVLTKHLDKINKERFNK